jgi:hypothetical protein
VLSHQPNGWTNAPVTSDYLRWLRSRIQTGLIVILWDLFSAHREQGVEALAQELGIRLVFIPAEMTGLYQPLDRRIFGSLKAGARARFDRYVTNGDDDLTMAGSITILLSAWRSISDEEVLETWAPLIEVKLFL